MGAEQGVRREQGNPPEDTAAPQSRLTHEEHFKLALEAGSMGTWEWHIPSDLVTWSPGFEILHGRPPGAFPRTLLDLASEIHADDRRHFTAALTESLRSGTDYCVEYRVSAADGDVRWLEGRGRVYNDSAGMPERMLGVSIDITARKIAEQALRESEERFALFMRYLPGAAWMKDREGTYVYLNEMAKALFRTTRPALGAKDSELFPPEVAAEFQKNDERAVAAGTGIQTVEILPLEDGPHHSLVSKFPIRDTAGETVWVGGVAIDITGLKNAESRLQAEYALRQALEASMPAGVTTVSREGRQLYTNPAFCRMTGWSVEELVDAMPPFVYWPPEEIPRIQAAFEQMLRGEAPPEGFQLRFQRRNGERFDALVMIAPLVTADPQTCGWLACVSDITEIQQLHRKIQQHETQLRLVIDGVPGLVAYADRDYQYRFNNRTYTQWFRRPAADFEGKSPAAFLTPETFAVAQRYLERAFQGETVNYETHAVFPDCERDIAVSYVPDRREDGSVRGTVIFVRDITSQKAAETALRQSEERFRRIVELATEGIWIVDPEGKTTFVNQSLVHILGYAAEEFAGKHYYDFILPEDREEGLKGFENRKGGNGALREYRFRRKDGRTVWLSFTGAPMRNDDGELVGVLGMCTDITERKLAEDQLRQTQKLESLGILAGGIAHDFNNLLVGIMGNATLAMEAIPRTSSARAMLRDVIAASERAAQLTRQMLAYAGKDQLTTAPTSLSALVRELTPLLKSSIPKHVHLVLHVDNNLPAVDADPAQMQQVIMNLVINAAEAVPENRPGAVTVTTAVRALTADDRSQAVIPLENTRGNFVAVTVADTGMGMDSETRSRIFDPFFSTKFAGRGLGLSAVLGIVRAHHGTITLATTPGHGTVFSVLLPATAASVPAAITDPNVLPLTGSGTVLLVDDEATVREMAQRALEFYGYQVLLAADGREGVEIFRTHPEIRAVLLDLAMPVLGGEQTAPELRRIRPDIPLILSSGYSEHEVAARFAGAGFSAFLQKPYSVQQLALKLHQALNR